MPTDRPAPPCRGTPTGSPRTPRPGTPRASPRGRPCRSSGTGSRAPRAAASRRGRAGRGRRPPVISTRPRTPAVVARRERAAACDGEPMPAIARRAPVRSRPLRANTRRRRSRPLIGSESGPRRGEGGAERRTRRAAPRRACTGSGPAPARGAARSRAASTSEGRVPWTPSNRRTSGRSETLVPRAPKGARARRPCAGRGRRAGRAPPRRRAPARVCGDAGPARRTRARGRRRKSPAPAWPSARSVRTGRATRRTGATEHAARVAPRPPGPRSPPRPRGRGAPRRVPRPPRPGLLDAGRGSEGHEEDARGPRTRPLPDGGRARARPRAGSERERGTPSEIRWSTKWMPIFSASCCRTWYDASAPKDAFELVVHVHVEDRRRPCSPSCRAGPGSGCRRAAPRARSRRSSRSGGNTGQLRTASRSTIWSSHTEARLEPRTAWSRNSNDAQSVAS